MSLTWALLCLVVGLPLLLGLERRHYRRVVRTVRNNSLEQAACMADLEASVLEAECSRSRAHEEARDRLQRCARLIRGLKVAGDLSAPWRPRTEPVTASERWVREPR